ncbi:hypothetical protein ATY31_28325 [Sinorhizobium americanum]|uniref:Uncharacterized protein n=1 Tax=Sinorhizobium americanum TaxID=194963 RepID=A0A2S3YGA8_9HYPH|nr:hypothetical protein ATY31_28325 [Sinorhizobium americanum]
MTASTGFRAEHCIRARCHARISAGVNERFARDGHWGHSVQSTAARLNGSTVFSTSMEGQVLFEKIKRIVDAGEDLRGPVLFANDDGRHPNQFRVKHDVLLSHSHRMKKKCRKYRRQQIGFQGF